MLRRRCICRNVNLLAGPCSTARVRNRARRQRPVRVISAPDRAKVEAAVAPAGVPGNALNVRAQYSGRVGNAGSQLGSTPARRHRAGRHSGPARRPPRWSAVSDLEYRPFGAGPAAGSAGPASTGVRVLLSCRPGGIAAARPPARLGRCRPECSSPTRRGRVPRRLPMRR